MPALRLAMYLDDGLICGGAERVARRLLSHWVHQGWEVFLVARASPTHGFFSLPPGVKGLSLHYSAAADTELQAGTRRPRSVFSSLPWFAPVRALARLAHEGYQLRRVLRQVDPDVAVALLTPANVKLVLATFGLRCGVVVSERTDTRINRYPRVWLALRRLLYRYADMVTANLAASVEDMARYVPTVRLLYVPNPVECPADDALALPRYSRRIISVGRLAPYKRHRMLIDMFAAAGDEFDGWELDIVGDGPMRTDLEQEIAARGLAGRVHLHGERHDVETFYRAGAIFVLPSGVEGTPNVLLEAMAHALPCVVSDAVTGALDYMEEGVTGYAFRQDSSADLADRVRSLVRAPERREAMGIRARELILAKSQDSAFAVWDRVIGLANGSGNGPDAAP